MLRRTFFKDLVLLSTFPFIAKACKPIIDKSESTESRVELVKKAMLSMQRASWEQGVAMQSLLEWGDESNVILMAYETVLRQTTDGRLSVLYTDNGVTDPASNGEAVLFAAEKTGDPDLKLAASKMLDYLINKAPKSPEGIIFHTLNAPEIWIDSMYMAPPFLSIAGEPEMAVKQIEGIRKFLWNDKAKLYSHRWQYEQQSFINEKFWGVGNGWALAGIARVIKSLPENMNKERNKLITCITEHLDSILKYLRPDGYFHNVVDDPASFVETNLGQMVVYTIYSGINGGWLNKKYQSIAETIRNAVLKKIDKFGYVQDVCGAPWFNSPGRATEGQAFFILMEAARKKLNLK